MRSRIAFLASLVVLVWTSSVRAQQKEGTHEEPAPETRPRWLWLSAEAGGTHVALETFDLDAAAPSAGFHTRTGDGPMIGVGGGLRLYILTLGPRARLGFTDEFRLATIGAELGLHVPLGLVEPHFHVGGGYASIGNLATGADRAGPEVSIDGVYGRLGGGLDFHASRNITVGTAVSGELYAMSPPGVDTSTPSDIRQRADRGDAAGAATRIREAEGTSYGSGFTISGTFGFNY